MGVRRFDRCNRNPGANRRVREQRYWRYLRQNSSAGQPGAMICVGTNHRATRLEPILGNVPIECVARCCCAADVGRSQADRTSQFIVPQGLAGFLCVCEGTELPRTRHFQMDVEMLGKQLIAPLMAISLVAGLAGCHGLRNDGTECAPKKSYRFHLDRFGPNTASLTPPTPDSSAYFGETAPPSSPASEADSEDEPAAPSREEAAARLAQIGGRLIESDSGEVVGFDAVRTEMSDADLPDLAAFPGLTELNLRETNVGDAGLEHVAELENLEFLGLTGTQVTDAGLPHLTRLTELRFLTLGNTDVTDEGLDVLAECARLEAINLKATRVSAEGVARLQSRLPLCRVVTDSLTSPQTPTSLDHSQDARPNGFSPYLPFDAPAPRSNPAAETLEIPLPPGGELDRDGSHTPPQTLPDVSSRTRRPAAMEMAAREVNWPAAPSDELRPRRERSLQIPPAVAWANPEERLMWMLHEKLEDPEVLRAFAQVHADRENWAEARRMLQAAVRLSPDDLSLRYELGVACARCGDFESAYENFEATVGAARAHYNLGVLLHEEGRTIAAAAEFRKALESDGSLSVAREWLDYVEGAKEISRSSEEHSFALTDEQIRRLFLPPTGGRTQALRQASFGDEAAYEVEIRPQANVPQPGLRR
ncbi:MAG: tetratricopeptide repeat protein [Planctomycetota bacterium]|nr:MAG: tetratricopeptide repeat protein [Planctomycetota bacterium]REK27269.1 MAG: tetratricopeptide repeat protein [Planctomycetota bacterium]REK36710.1 MAG: tetratricopeptide repeat protein [Planctomycetota bacterium]